MKLRCPLILASGSPRRRELLKKIGLSFTIHISDVEETINPSDYPQEIVQKLARKKANAVAPSYPDALTLAADTIVVFEGKILGKPRDKEDATNMLKQLNSNKHLVYTGIALQHPATNRSYTISEETKVTFASMSDTEIEGYVSTGSPMDKAGSYGIQDDQGALYIAGIEGDYYNVVGLPLHAMYNLLKTNFDDLLII